MAGAGSRFVEAGFKEPKPLIPILGKTMIERVVENLDLPDAKYLFIVQQEHRQNFPIDVILNRISNGKCEVVETKGLLPGALHSILTAENILETDDELLIANSDQLVVARPIKFVEYLRNQRADGGIMTFKASGKKWSYALINEQGYVERVAEKEEISNNATVGVYYWRSSSYFLECARKFVKRNLPTNGEFYVSPVFNEAISERKKIVAIASPKHVSLGTPELLAEFIRQHQAPNAE